MRLLIWYLMMNVKLTEMTLEEAKTEMRRGNRVTHEYFEKDEFMYYSGGDYYFEDGVRIVWELFFLDRKPSLWKNEYSIYE